MAYEREVEEVDDFAGADAVDEVADGPAEDRGHADPADPIGGRQPHVDRAEQGEGQDRREPEEQQAEPGMGAGQDAERRAGVPDIGDVEEAGDYGDGLVQTHY